MSTEPVQPPEADNRPEVYFENGVIVIRASAMGGCIRNMVAARKGIRAIPFSAKSLQRMNEGVIHEPHILAHLDSIGWKTVDTQAVLELPIAGGSIVIRGHSDGTVRHEQRNESRVAEVKAQGAAVWEKWKKCGWEEFRRYAYQLSIYMAITGLPGLFATKNRDTGEVDVSYWDEAPISVAQLKARAIKIATMADLPECDPGGGVSLFGCFAAGTLVLTDQGYRPIEQVRVGDRVLTHRGRWRPVTHLKPVESKATRMVTGYGIPGLVTTDEHPFLARERSYHHRSKSELVREFTNAEWVAAEKLGRNWFVAQTLPPVDDRAPRLTKPQWWLMGRWVADGTIDRDRYIELNIGHDKADTVEAWIQQSGWTASRTERPTATVFYFRQPGATLFSDTILSGFGKLAHGKRLPGFMFTLDRESTKAFLDGYLAGDGHLKAAGYQRSRSDHWQATTTSRELAYGVALLAQRAYGTLASILARTPAATGIIEGRTVNQRPCWAVRIPMDATPTRGRSWFLEADIGWKPVRDSLPTGRTELVYDLTVEEDESYVVQGVVAHNCQRYFIHTGDHEIDPFTGLEIKKGSTSSTTAKSVPDDKVAQFEELARQYQEAKDAESVAETRKKEIGALLLTFLSAHDLKKGVTEEWVVAEVSRNDSRLDQRALKIDHPEIAKQYTIESKSRYVSVKRREDVE